MITYQVNEMRRIRDYTTLADILTRYSMRKFNFDGKLGTLSFTIPKTSSVEIERELKEGGLIFGIQE